MRNLKFKRLISIIAATAMCISLLPATVFAHPSEENAVGIFNAHVEIPEAGTRVSDTVISYPSGQHYTASIYDCFDETPGQVFDRTELNDTYKAGHSYILEIQFLATDGYRMSYYEKECTINGRPADPGTAIGRDAGQVFIFKFKVPGNAYKVTVHDAYAPYEISGGYSPDDVVILTAGERPGYEFKRWIVNSDNVYLINPTNPDHESFRMPAANVEITAKWIREGEKEPIDKMKFYLSPLKVGQKYWEPDPDNNGGFNYEGYELSPNHEVIQPNTVYTLTLYVSAREGFKFTENTKILFDFEGSYSYEANGTEERLQIDVTFNRTPAENSKDDDFTYIPPVDEQNDLPIINGNSVGNFYEIAVDDVKNGSVNVSSTAKQAGSKVSIETIPDKNYVVSSIYVKDNRGNRIALAKESDNHYSFTMPNSPVMVSVNFIECYVIELDPQPAIPAVPVTPTAPDNKPTDQNPDKDADKNTEKLPDKAESKKFDDIAPNAWYSGAADYVYRKGLMAGTSDKTFAPDAVTNRAMIVSILHRLEGSPAPKGGNPFSDVKNGMWYTESIKWAVENNIVAGYGNGIFKPDTPITSEQLVSILYRYAAFKGYDLTKDEVLKEFSVDSVSSWANEAVRWGVKNNLIFGSGAEAVIPKNNAARANAAAFLMHFCENVIK